MVRERLMRRPHIAIIDYGMGNIRSVHNALLRLGCTVVTSFRPEDMFEADALILPGVGAFGEAVANLKARELIEPIQRAVRDEGKPLLGICLGMQLLAETSEEGGVFEGLSLVRGEVRRINVSANFRIPHMGWNTLSIKKQQPLFGQLADGDAFYFVHSYQLICDSDDVAATTTYESDIVAAVQHNHVFGVQFHPERSQRKGLELLRNFVDVAAGPASQAKC